MQFPIRKISFLPAAGMALFPFILVKHASYKKDPYLINHERIHIYQQIELLVLFFYLFYVIHYLLNLLRYRNHHKAYANIVFEKEAFSMDHDISYLEKRKIFSWFKFF